MARERMPNRMPPADRVRGKYAGRCPAAIVLLHDRCCGPNPGPKPLGGPQAWLGEAIAIKDPTAAVFRPQNGCNLLLIGQRDEAALGIMAVALASLCAARHTVQATAQ